MHATHTEQHAPTLAEVQATLAEILESERAHMRLPLSDAVLDEVAQDLLIMAWKRDLARYDPARGTLRAFLRTRTRWSLLDRARQEVRALLFAPIDLLAEEEFCDNRRALTHTWIGADPEALLAAVDEEQRLCALDRAIDEAIASIEDDQAYFAVVAHDLAGAPMQEVAFNLDVHPSNAGRARQRGLAHLRRVLEPTMEMALAA